MRTLIAVHDELKSVYSRLRTWRKVGEEYGINYAMAWKVAHGHDPKRANIRIALGLSVFVPAPICPVHQMVHVGKCPRPRVYKTLFDIPAKELRRMFENRVEMEA